VVSSAAKTHQDTFWGRRLSVHQWDRRVRHRREAQLRDRRRRGGCGGLCRGGHRGDWVVGLWLGLRRLRVDARSTAFRRSLVRIPA